MKNGLGNKEIMAKNILYYMDLHGKSRQDMCDALGVKYTTFTGWVTADSYPRIDKIELMANYFGIEKSDLVEQRNRTANAKCVKIPVLGRVAAGVPIEQIEDVAGYEEISLHLADRGDFFALKIRGDSMSPKIEDGDVVIIRKQETAETGDIVIASINGEDATCKKFRKTDSGVVLISLNSDYDPFIFSAEQVETLPVRIIGKVVEMRRKF